MPKILELDPHVADMIAAGEVVERPASVVKELLENAADAGATVITLEIRRGGMSYIRVTDNGCGMAPEDARTAFLRHATSKLRDERGLEAIGTLGFRGEALAAISAVSRVELLTKEPGTENGTRLILEASQVLSEEPAGCPDGTTIIVRDLFYNTPARLKFMKTDRAETGAVTAAAQRFALSRPELSLRYLRDGQEEFHTPGNGSDRDCIYNLLGREMAAEMLRVQGEANDVTVQGYVCAPRAARGNRTMQIFFVNGRLVKSRVLQAALEQAYRNQLFTGRYPSCVLYLKMKLSSVDVNVHPAKTEVRFLREKEVFDAVYYSVLSALDGSGGTAELPLSASTREVLGGTPSAQGGGAGQAFPSGEAAGESAAAPRFRNTISTPAASGASGLRGHVSVPTGSFQRREAGSLSMGSFGRSSLRDGGGAYYQAGSKPLAGISITGPSEDELPEPPLPPVSVPVPAQVEVKEATTESLFSQLPSEENAEQTEIPMETKNWRLIGEALTTYILVDTPDALVLIDKHAAHERVNFDRLMAQREPPASQPLLAPVILTPAPEDLALLLDSRAILEEYGFELDAFGEDSVALRSVPMYMDIADAPGSIEMILEELRLGGGDPIGFRDAVLHTIACKAAIKAGKNTDLRELEGLADKVMRGEVRYCPHGRPVSASFSKQELDHRFKRA